MARAVNYLRRLLRVRRRLCLATITRGGYNSRGMTLRSPFPQDAQGRYADCDALLQPYLNAEDEEELKSLAAALIADHAAGIIKSTIRSKLGGLCSGLGGHREDADDLYGEVVLELLARLRNLKSNPKASPITDFRGFVRLLSYRACSRQFRRIDPTRHSISGKVRYQLTVNPDFALWLDGRNEWLCGFREWRDEGRPSWKPGPGQPRNVFELFHDALSQQDEARIEGLQALASALFDWAAAPMELDDVIDVAARFLGAKDQVSGTRWSARSYAEPNENIPDLRVDIAADAERHAFLDRVWTEVKSLPLRQRRTLLLNLRDALGQGVAALIPVTGVASVEDLARVLEMSLEELQGIWNNLPLDDATIATQLGLSRQQVINLRRAARERLQRRLRGWGTR